MSVGFSSDSSGNDFEMLATGAATPERWDCQVVDQAAVQRQVPMLMCQMSTLQLALCEQQATVLATQESLRQSEQQTAELVQEQRRMAEQHQATVCMLQVQMQTLMERKGNRAKPGRRERELARLEKHTVDPGMVSTADKTLTIDDNTSEPKVSEDDEEQVEKRMGGDDRGDVRQVPNVTRLTALDAAAATAGREPPEPAITMPASGVALVSPKESPNAAPLLALETSTASADVRCERVRACLCSFGSYSRRLVGQLVAVFMEFWANVARLHPAECVTSLGAEISMSCRQCMRNFKCATPFSRHMQQYVFACVDACTRGGERMCAQLGVCAASCAAQCARARTKVHSENQTAMTLSTSLSAPGEEP
jgi:hypothetical protein